MRAQPIQGSELRLSKYKKDFAAGNAMLETKPCNAWNKPGSEVQQLFHSPA